MEVPFSYGHRQRADVDTLLLALMPGEIGYGLAEKEWWGCDYAGNYFRIDLFIDPRRYGARFDDSTNDYQALQDSLDACADANGGVVLLPVGAAKCISTLDMPQRNIILKGHGADVSTIRHVPTGWSDLMTINTGGEGFIVCEDFQVRGKGYQTGDTRYLISAANLNENCIFRNLQFRNSMGLLKITAGYLSTLKNLRFNASTPRASGAGVSNTDWLDVWDEGHAPVDLKSMNGCEIGPLHFYRVGSEVTNGVTPSSPLLIQASQATEIGPTQFEGMATYTDGLTYTVRQKSLIKAEGAAALTLNTVYMEGCFCTEHLIHASKASQVKVDGITAYNMDCTSDLFRHEGVWDMKIENGMLYKIRSPTLYKVNQSGYSTQGKVRFENVMVSGGDIFSDTAVSADIENVNDTYGTSHLLGVANEDDQTLSPQNRIFPRVLNGLTVTNSSNPTYTGVGVATGHYIQVTSGIFQNQRGECITVKRPTGNPNVSNLAVFRLRPTTASKYYRVYVGEAGNLYLVQSNSAFTDMSGDWLASFQTDGSTAITTLAANARLSYSSTYLSRQHRLKAADIVSAATITMGVGNSAVVTGATTIDLITSTDFEEGDFISLRFQSALTVRHNQAASAPAYPIWTKSRANLSIAADDALLLMFQGNLWYEM
jgi:hypothetical protein